MEDHSTTNKIEFNVYSNLAGAICDSKFIESKVNNENNEGEFDYINYRYLDALARIVSVWGNCAAVFVRNCRSPEEQETILTSQMKSTFYNLKSKIDRYRTQSLEKIKEWEEALDEDIQPKDTLKHLLYLEKEIKVNLKDNDCVSKKLETEKLKWDSIQTVLNTTLYIAYNSTVTKRESKNVINNILKGINRSMSMSDHTSLVKIAFLTNKKFNILLFESSVALNNNPHLVETTTEVYKDYLQKLTKELRSSYAMFEKDSYPEDAIKKIPYESIEFFLSSNWIKTEPFNRLRVLSLRIFQDATKLYAMSQDKEKWVSLNNYKIVENEANIHAEIALVMKIREYDNVLHEVPTDSLKNILPYIGISKLSCPLCHRTLDLLGVKHLGTHNILYAGEKVWKSCEMLQAEHERELIKIIKDHLISQIPNLQSNLEKDKVIKFEHKLDPEISDDDEIESGILIDYGYTCKTLKQIKDENL